jgi:hypothetical protein
MAQGTVAPAKIKTLADWVSRYPKTTNIGFDPETREPTIYDTTKARAKVSSIPWKREADVMTVLTQPSRFSTTAVVAATARYNKLHEQTSQMQNAMEEQLRLAEATLLEAWRAYRAAPPQTRGVLRNDIMAAENSVRDIERSMANKSRITVKMPMGTGVYIPPMPVKLRGLTIEEMH